MELRDEPIKSSINSTLTYFTLSEPGHGHLNEDTLEVRPHPDDANVKICALADGQGGQAGGALAARKAVEAAVEKAISTPVRKLVRRETWTSILSSSDEEVSGTDGAGYTTLIALCVGPEFVCGASCGDSAALLMTGGVTHELTGGQRKNPPVGSSAARPVAFSQKLNAPWRLLVMSDGVWKYAGWEEVTRQLQTGSGKEILEALREAAATGGKLRDDFSAAVFTTPSSERDR